MRVVFDTYVIVSAMLSPSAPPAQLVAAWEAQAFELCVSESLLSEYHRALSYERVASRHGMSSEETTLLIEEFRQFAVVLSPGYFPPIIADDPDDDKVLACAVEAGASFVVSGDRHLLAVQEYQGIQILSPTAFLTLLQHERTE